MHTAGKWRAFPRCLFISAAFILLLLCVSKVLADTEKEYIEKVRIKIKLKEYTEAAAVLEEAQKMYPGSIELAKLAVDVHQKTGNIESLIEACSTLIELLELKEVKEGALSTAEARLLKSTQKKLQKIAEIRMGVDNAVKSLVNAGIESCANMLKEKKCLEASFVYLRLCGLKPGNEKVMELGGQLLQVDTDMVKRPEASESADEEKAEKLLIDAYKSFKRGDLDDAALTCKAALEADPMSADARAMLCDIAEKKGNSKEMMLQGLAYLLFPLDRQSCKRAEKIEKRLVKVSEQLKGFFSTTKKSAGEICKLIGKAVKEKKETDIQYGIQRLQLLSHRTKKIDYALSKASSTGDARKGKLAIKRGILLVDETFSGPSSNWYQKEGYAYPEKGKFIVKSEPERSFIPRYLSNFTPSAFYIESEIELLSSAKKGTAGGLSFRVESNSSYYMFMISPDGKFGAWLISQGNKKDLTGKESAAVGKLICCVPSKRINRGKKKNLIAVAFVESTLQCYINGHLVFTGSDDTYKKGTVGFIVAKGNHLYAFDNYKVYEASLPGK